MNVQFTRLILLIVVLVSFSDGLRIRQLQYLRKKPEKIGHDEKSVVVLGASVELKSEKMKRESSEADITTTEALVAANVLLFVTALVVPGMKQQWMKINHRIASGETYRLLTATFMHAGPIHLAVNCNSLSSIGPLAERIFGKGKYLAIYAGAGVLANTFTYLCGFAPQSLGASGCICGIMGAFGAYYWINRRTLGSRTDEMLKVVRRDVFMTLLYGMASTNVSNWGHLGGYGAGAVLAFCLAPRLDRPRVINRNRGDTWASAIPAMWQRRGRWSSLHSIHRSVRRSVSNFLSTMDILDSSQRSQRAVTTKGVNW